MKTLALVTMIFLPPTAVATIFQMPFFNWNGEGSAPIVNSRFWIYCVISLFLTIAILAVWWIWSRRQEKVKTGWHTFKYKVTNWEKHQIIRKNSQETVRRSGNDEREPTASEWVEADGHAAALRVTEIGSGRAYSIAEAHAMAIEKGNRLRDAVKPRWRSPFTFHKSAPLSGKQEV
jgi:hypothetical protein